MKCRILIGEDDLEDQLILREFFGQHAINEVVAFEKNGQRILEFLRKNSAIEDLPQLVVLDLNMPILNGTQTLYEIKQDPRLSEIPVIIYSTSTNEHEKRKCLNFGAVDYIVKPVTVAEGDEMVRRFMEFVSLPNEDPQGRK